MVGVLRRGESKRSIGLRADLDALPIEEENEFEHRSVHESRFHGCGHDGHTTMLLAAAESLAGKDTIDGTVNFIFQPNEENGLGAVGLYFGNPISFVDDRTLPWASALARRPSS